MAHKELSQTDLQLLTEIVQAAGGDPSKGMWLVVPHVCDRCQDENKEAFPCYVTDKDGRLWADLCNDCFEVLGCSYGDDDD